jgi:addiction module HigA family antidote
MDKNLSPIHPGEVLLEDFMKPLGLSQYRLAKDIGVTPIRISQIVNGQRSITVDTDMRLARYFGTSTAVWLHLQMRYDIEVADIECFPATGAHAPWLFLWKGGQARQLVLQFELRTNQTVCLTMGEFIHDE